jgi:hypothetical protein
MHYYVGNLVELNLSHNALTTCAGGGLDRLYSLERLWLHNNALPDLASIRGLACLPQLAALTLYGNPLVTAVGSGKYFYYTSAQGTSSSSWFFVNGRQNQPRIGTSTNVPSVLSSSSSSSVVASYRLAVLDLFCRGQRRWRLRSNSVAENADDDNDNEGDIFELSLDGEAISSQEKEMLLAMSYFTQLPAPDYHLPEPTP